MYLLQIDEVSIVMIHHSLSIMLDYSSY